MTTKPRHQRLAAFTLLEIMIAVAVLVIGILGVLALFPVAMNSGRMTIQDTNAAIIAESVEQAIRDGLANRKGQSKDGKFTYFIFQHHGVQDAAPSKVSEADYKKDYYILLPGEASDGTSGHSRKRKDAYQNGRLFVYPESDGLSWSYASDPDRTVYEQDDNTARPNGGGDANQADNDGDDRTLSSVTLPNGSTITPSPTFEVERVYQLNSNFLRKPDREIDTEVVNVFEADDPLGSYSFAFTVRTAYLDPSLGREHPTDASYTPSNELYEFEVLVFRGFARKTKMALTPIYRSRFLAQK